MAIELIDTIKPKNGGSFPMVEAQHVAMPDGSRLSEFNPGSGLPEIAPASETAVLEDQVLEGFADGQVLVSPAIFELVVGDTYRVIWDGTEHECVCTDSEGYLITDGVLDETLNIVTPPTFVLMYGPADLTGVEGGMNAAMAFQEDGSADPATSHTVSLYHVVKSADEGKFLRVVDGKLALVALTDVSEVGM